MTTMKAVQILGSASSPRVTTTNTAAKPVPTNAEILLRVCAAGVTGDEVLWPEVYQRPSRIPGHEVSGIIESLGPEYRGDLRVGHEIAAYLAAEHGAGQAEYTICRAYEVARKPSSITHEEAAALPIPILTAWQAIFEHAKLAPDARVLVTGASGAVGTIAVQVAAKMAKARVVALASSRNHTALIELGALETHDYNTPGWEDQIRDVDAVLDTVGGDVLSKIWQTIKGDGVIVTVGDPAPEWAFNKAKAAESADRPDVRYVYFIVSPDAEALSEVLETIEAGGMKALEVNSFPFEEAERAWTQARQRRRGKKVVITF